MYNGFCFLVFVCGVEVFMIRLVLILELVLYLDLDFLCLIILGDNLIMLEELGL